VSVLVVAPELVASAAADLESIGSAVNAAHRAAAVRTTGLAAAAADEVSAALSALFTKYGADFQALSAHAGAFHEKFLQALSSGFRSYLAAETAGASLLRGGVDAAAGLTGASGTVAAGAVINDVKLFVDLELGIYDFSTPRGWAAFLLDYTWGLPYTAVGYGVQLINLFDPNAGYDPVLSKEVGSIVYRGGLSLQPGFATTMGNVTTNLGYGPGADDLMRNHEGLHVWQNRIFGPLYWGSYGAWGVGGAIVGTGYWLLHPNLDWYSLVQTTAYYDNPWEVWAYANDHLWPPPWVSPVLLW
jgi:hypothetical protein